MKAAWITLFGFLVAMTCAVCWRYRSFLMDNGDQSELRVRTAEANSLPTLHALFDGAGVPFPPGALYLRATKVDRRLEVFASGGPGSKMALIKSYPVLAASGALGPKRKEGDRQVPEGFYEITQFNPNSKFHLSMRVSYPNKSDRILSDQTQPGSDIFVHGDNKSIGCLAMGDPAIEELYTLCRAFKGATGHNPRIDIFPTRMTRAVIADLAKDHPDFAKFWGTLKLAWDFFEKNGYPPSFSVDKAGAYLIVKG